MSNTRHIQALDGVRGIAVLGVVLCHTLSILKDVPHLTFLEYGATGVDLFFVLSGFLITSILLREKSKPGYYKNFYFRRALRIWPLYYLYLLLMETAVRVLPHVPAYQRLAAHSSYLQGSPLQINTPLIVCLLLAQNLWPPSQFGAADQTSISWSLCVEEQFYFVWPFFVRRLSQKQMMAVLSGAVVLEPVLRAIVLHRMRNPEVAWVACYHLPVLHCDAICAGCLLALLWPAVKDRRETRPVLAAMFFLSLALCFVFLPVRSPFSYTAAALLSTSIVGLALSGVMRRFLSAKPLVFAGAISYGLYLIHPTVFEFLQSRSLYGPLAVRLGLRKTEVLAAVVAVLVSITIAAISRYTFEAFFLRFKDRKSQGEAGELLALQAHPAPEPQ